ncbi:MAG: transcriptional regulator [Candidatus Woesebacteria bacterium GW2011_GWC2_40_30]|nr:MAG: transcriptional regulator [Candidatus Woesebacteria bacterium GW2011_GWC2_40_30]
MSGHSHFATIKRQKAVNDAAKGNLFSKMARAIMIAAKSGGDPDMNFKLRFEIDKARAVSMPKENIERAIAKATTEAANLEEITYEGFGPGGIGVIKNLFDRAGGSMGGPNSVAFNFESKGFMVIKKKDDPDAQMLQLIDAGAEDMEDIGSSFEIYVAPDKLGQIHKALVAAGFEVTETELQMKPKNFVTVTDPSTAGKIMKFIDEVESHDDVQNVFINADIPDDVMSKI